jgi:hypothetical protein
MGIVVAVHIRITRRGLLCIALSAFAAACVNQGNERVEKVMKLQTDMSRDQVLSIMGEPQRREVHGNVEFLIYRTDTSEEEGWNFTPVGLVDGRVAGWGRVYYEAAKGSRIGPDGGMSKKR